MSVYEFQTPKFNIIMKEWRIKNSEILFDSFAVFKE